MGKIKPTLTINLTGLLGDFGFIENYFVLVIFLLIWLEAIVPSFFFFFFFFGQKAIVPSK